LSGEVGGEALAGGLAACGDGEGLLLLLLLLEAGEPSACGLGVGSVSEGDEGAGVNGSSLRSCCCVAVRGGALPGVVVVVLVMVGRAGIGGSVARKAVTACRRNTGLGLEAGAIVLLVWPGVGCARLVGRAAKRGVVQALVGVVADVGVGVVVGSGGKWEREESSSWKPWLAGL